MATSILRGLVVLTVWFPMLLMGQAFDYCSNPVPLIPFCYDMPYNTTSFPNNVYKMINATEAEMELVHLSPLVDTGCSDILREFLCSVYFPECEAGYGDVYPCMETCESVRRDCEEVLNKFGFKWPREINCVKYPSKGEKSCTYFESKLNDITTSATSKLNVITTPATSTSTLTESNRTATTSTTVRPDQCSDSSTLPPLCVGMSYNTSSFPNSVLGFKTAAEARMEVHQYFPLIKIQCSDVIKEFLCSAYFPECDPDHGDIPPCRESCEFARDGCIELMERFGFNWPPSLNCERFPSRGSKLCAYYETKLNTTTTSTTTLSTTTTSRVVLPDTCQIRANKVALPNVLGHGTLEEALDNFLKLESMMLSACSPHISQYLCRLHFPSKYSPTRTVKPCWEFCLQVRTDCLLQLPVPWPKSFHCETFPSINTMDTSCWGSVTSTTILPTTQSTTTSIVTLPATCNIRSDEVALPNTLGHWTMKDALHNFLKFESMLSSACSSHLSEYLCDLHFPSKTMSNRAVKPCWEFCIQVRSECLLQLPVPWPRSFQCETFPSKITQDTNCWSQSATDAQATLSSILKSIQDAFKSFVSLFSFG